jgi:hypothetical protein
VGEFGDAEANSDPPVIDRFAEARASRIAIRSGSSALASFRAQRVFESRSGALLGPQCVLGREPN